MVPTRTGKPGKMRKTFFQSGKSQGISNRLEKSGKFTQKYWKMKFYPKYWKSGGFLTIFYFYFFSDILIEVYLVKYIFVFVKFIK